MRLLLLRGGFLLRQANEGTAVINVVRFVRDICALIEITRLLIVFSRLR